MVMLLKLLADGRFHSGQALGAALGVSRSAVWKQLQQLEADLGVVVHKVRGRGYRLEVPISLLDSTRLAAELAQLPGPQWEVQLFDTIDSTNAEALRQIEAGRSAPFLILAERQTAGRGRRGRNWVSPYGVNLYYSLVLRVEGGMRKLEGLSLVVGLAVRSALADMGIEGAGLKWPNDVLVAGQKIAGILLELVGDPADVCHVVIGVGINVNMRDAAEIDQQWTSMQLLSKAVVDRNVLVTSLCNSLRSYLSQHDAHGFSALKEQWEQAHAWQGRLVSLVSGSRVIEGQVVGIDKQGALRMLVEGKEQVFSGGELSLRLKHDS